MPAPPDSERLALALRDKEELGPAEEMAGGEMSWVGKKIHLYNVTMGLYMLDWWERCLFSILPLRLRPIQFLLYCSLCKFRTCLC